MGFSVTVERERWGGSFVREVPKPRGARLRRYRGVRFGAHLY